MTYDELPVLKAFHSEQSLSFPLLRDEDAKHVEAFGVRNEQYPPGDPNYGLPHPGILFITPEGVVAMKFAVPGYRQRPPFEDVLQAVSERVGP